MRQKDPAAHSATARSRKVPITFACCLYDSMQVLYAGEVEIMFDAGGQGGAGDGVYSALDKQPAQCEHNLDIYQLLPDFQEVENVENAYYRRTSVFPIIRLVAVKREVYERNTLMGSLLYRIFYSSKQLALDKDAVLGCLALPDAWLANDLDEPPPYSAMILALPLESDP